MKLSIHTNLVKMLPLTLIIALYIYCCSSSYTQPLIVGGWDVIVALLVIEVYCSPIGWWILIK